MLNFSTFSVGGCLGQPVLLFKKLDYETQMPIPQECTDTFILTKKLFLVCLWSSKYIKSGRKTLYLLNTIYARIKEKVLLSILPKPGGFSPLLSIRFRRSCGSTAQVFFQFEEEICKVFVLYEKQTTRRQVS